MKTNKIKENMKQNDDSQVMVDQVNGKTRLATLTKCHLLHKQDTNNDVLYNTDQAPLTTNTRCDGIWYNTEQVKLTS